MFCYFLEAPFSVFHSYFSSSKMNLLDCSLLKFGQEVMYHNLLKHLKMTLLILRNKNITRLFSLLKVFTIQRYHIVSLIVSATLLMLSPYMSGNAVMMYSAFPTVPHSNFLIFTTQTSRNVAAGRELQMLLHCPKC